MHGSAEAPAIFADLVCAALASKRPIVVGVERSTAEQGAIDAFLTGENHEAATRAFLSHKGWHTFDGRSSRAMLEMLESLRALRVEVVAFAAARPADTPVQVEQRMAAALMAAASRHPKALLLALTGNVHGSRKPIAEIGGYPLMAMHLPQAETLTLMVTDKGGESWSSMNGSCGPHKVNSSGGVRRGVDLSTAAPMAGYDGVLSTGLPSTASPPAIENAPPPPACSG